MKNRINFTQDRESRALGIIPCCRSIIRSINLVYYEPGVDMPMHAHQVGQFSTMLCGQSQEQNLTSDMEIPIGMVAYKPIAYRHRTKIGPKGAIFLSIDINAEQPDFVCEYGKLDWALSDIKIARCMWQTLLTSILSDQAAKIDFETLVFGLLERSVAAPRKLKGAPAWLKLAQQALIDTPLPVGEIAKKVGVHRVHLCRAFQDHFGLSVSQFRQREMLQGSLFSMFSGNSDLASSSVNSGFADQSHFTRTLKQHFGITPLKLQRLLSPSGISF